MKVTYDFPYGRKTTQEAKSITKQPEGVMITRIDGLQFYFTKDEVKHLEVEL